MGIIAFISSKYGVGKTFLAVNLGVQVSTNYRVLLVDTDFFFPRLHEIFPNTNNVNRNNQFFNDFYLSKDKRKSISSLIIPSRQYNNLDLIYCRFAGYTGAGEITRITHVANLSIMTRQLKELNYDFILLNSPPGMDFMAVNNIVVSNILFVVLKPTLSSFYRMKNILDNYQYSLRPRNRSHYVVLNQVPLFNSEKMQVHLKKLSRRLLAEHEFIDQIFTIPLCMNALVTETVTGSILSRDLEILSVLDKIKDSLRSLEPQR